MLPTSLLSTILSLGAAMLALSLLVQVVQEVYKYLTSSKPRAYMATLIDFLGPHAEQLKRPGMLPDIQVRGPFQFLRRRPTGWLQPMDKPELIAALERTATPWVQRAVKALKLEAEIQNATPGPPTPAFLQFLSGLTSVAPGTPGYFTAQELQEFFAGWLGDTNILDAPALLLALRHRFLPSVVQVEASFSQLSKNMDYAYRRRNLRQTFTFGFLLAALFQLPFTTLYQRATAASLEEAISAAENARAIYAQEAARDSNVRTPAELRRLADSLTALLGKERTGSVAIDWSALRAEFASVGGGARYLLGCLITALLVSFGAPFWNDLTGVLVRAAKGSSPAPAGPSEKQEPGG